MATAVDPAISHVKFHKEVEYLRQLGPDLRKRGWLIEATSFPTLRVTFLAMTNTPYPVAILTVEVDFTNYDVWPPSVRLFHPGTMAPLRAETDEQVRRLVRKRPDGQDQQMIVWAVDPPFVCIPGIREYHANPEHTGDSWFLHRTNEPGWLYQLLESLWTHSAASVKGYTASVKGYNVTIGLAWEVSP